MLKFSLQLPQLDHRMAPGVASHAVELEHDIDPPAPSGPKPSLLDGESLTNVVTPVAYALARKRGGGGEFDGALHITNFRLILQRTGPGKATFGSCDSSLEWVSFPMGCIKSVIQAVEDPMAIILTAKDLRSCRMRFESRNALFVSTLTQIIGSMAMFAQASPERAFAMTHAAAAQRKRAENDARMSPEGVHGELLAATAADGSRAGANLKNDGWLTYDVEREFARQGVIRPKCLDSPERTDQGLATPCVASSTGREAEEPPRWRLFHNRSHDLVPTYPLRFVVPAAMTDADIRAVAAYRSKGRLPAMTWMDPKTKAVLTRSAQPLAGLGGKSCAEDEKLLGFFREKGEQLADSAAPVVHVVPSVPSVPSVSRTAMPPPSPSLFSLSSFSASPSPSPSYIRRLSPHGPKPKLESRVNRRSTTAPGACLKLDEDGSAIATDRSRSDVAPASLSTRGKEKENAANMQQRARAGSDSRGGRRTGGGGASEGRTAEEMSGDFGDTFLNFVGMTSWTPPWSTTRVSVQQPNGGLPDKGFARSEPGKQRQGGQTDEQQQGEGGAAGDGRRRGGGGGGGAARGKGDGAGGVVVPPSPTAAAKGVKGAGRGDGDPRLCVLDARTAVAAMGNQLVGKGVETGAGYGSSTQLVFSGIGNVHAVNDAFEELRNALDPAKMESRLDRWKGDAERWKGDAAGSVIERTSRGLGFTKALDLRQVLGEELEEGVTYTQWPKLLRQILGASVLAARLLRLKGCSVLVHCSDGWDRTPQICSTVQLLLDPYYRTLEGFCVLIEKEWLSFGHKFWARCMGGSHENVQDRHNGEETMSSMAGFVGGPVKGYEELSPVFVQFLDLVHSVVAQFPNAFEFTEDLLAFVAEHTFSGLFGTFLCDTERRRLRLKLKQRTVSIWTVVLDNRARFANPNYRESQEPLWPSLAPGKIRLWERQHCRVPSLRPHDLFNTQPWEDHISVTLDLVHGGGGVS